MEFLISAQTARRIRSFAFLAALIASIVGLVTALNDAFGLTLFGIQVSAESAGITSIVALLLGFYVDAWLYRFQHSLELEALREDVRRSEQTVQQLESQLVSSIRREFEVVRPLPVNVYLMSRFLGYAPLYVALRLNFFKEEGLDVTLHSCLTDSGAVVALAKQRGGFAICDPMALLEADDEIRALATAANDIRIISPFINKVSMLLASRRPLADLVAEAKETGRSLKFLTYAEGSTSYNLSRRLAAKLAAQGAAVTVEPINRLQPPELAQPPKTSTEAAMRHYDIVKHIMAAAEPDVIVFAQPDVDWLAGQYGYGHTTPLHDELYSRDEFFAFTGVLTTTNMLEQSPELVRRFLKALRMAMKFMYALPPLPIGDQEIFQELTHDEKVRLEEVVTHTMEWERAVDAVLKTTQDVYPGVDLRPEQVAFILEWMRRNSHFSRGLYFDHRIERGFNTARAAHPSGAGWDIKRLLHATDLYA